MLSHADIYPFATLKSKGSCLSPFIQGCYRGEGKEDFKKVADQLQGGYRKALTE